MFQLTRKTAIKYGALPAAMLASLSAFAAATTPEAAIGEAVTLILAIVAVAGAAYISVALAGVGWNVGAKFIKRIGGKA